MSFMMFYGLSALAFMLILIASVKADKKDITLGTLLGGAFFAAIPVLNTLFAALGVIAVAGKLGMLDKKLF